jgi:transcriptional regulator with XRE-family HTH domain
MESAQTETFGQWLKSRRKSLDVTREHLAMCASCSPATIEKIEAGRRRPSRQLAEILAQCLGIPHDQIAEFVPFARGTVAYFYPANAPQE